jgi:small subunit ribosomal protein S11
MVETTKKDSTPAKAVVDKEKKEKTNQKPQEADAEKVVKIKIEKPEEKKEGEASEIIGEKTTKTVKKKKNIRQITHGRAYVQATYNNTIITLTDLNGNVLSWSSAGQNGFKGPKKATPYAASVIVKDAVEKASVYGLKNVNAYVKGVGSGREAAVRALNTYGLNVISIKDITPIPHNGCRARKPRRI